MQVREVKRDLLPPAKSRYAGDIQLAGHPEAGKRREVRPEVKFRDGGQSRAIFSALRDGGLDCVVDNSPSCPPEFPGCDPRSPVHEGGRARSRGGDEGHVDPR